MPAEKSPPSGSPPSARTDEKRRVESIVARSSISASPASTSVAVSPSTSTITAALSASGTSDASPFVTTPTVPRCSPDAMPGSQRCFCSSLPPCRIASPAAAQAREPRGRVREQLCRRKRVAELLHHDHELSHAELLPTVFLGDED